MRTTSNHTASADVPIPSVETEPWVRCPSEDTDSSAGHVRTPSFSISPPPEASPNGVRPQSIGLESQMRSIQLAGNDEGRKGVNSDLKDLLHAVDAVDRGSDESAAANSDTGSPIHSAAATPRSSRRRSGQSPFLVDVPPHKVQDEPAPEDIFHSPAFQQAFRDAKRLTSKVRRVLDDSPLLHDHESTISKLHQEAVELSSFEYPSSRKIGFVGDSGVGKSSLLNSLLDCKDLARASNRGEACTCVVTEYHYHNHDYVNIEVDLFTADEIDEQLERMLQDYRHYSFHVDEMATAEEKKLAKDKAKVAQDTFMTMFRGRLHNTSFLLRGAESDVLHSLVRWASDLRPSQTIVSRKELSLQECSDALVSLSSEGPSQAESSQRQPAVWPFIKTINVFLNAHVLKEGLILVDLPGLRDLNAARRCITERYILRCNEIFVICNIGRAVTDEGVFHVFNLAERARLRNVGIVCTRSEDIILEEALRDWDGTRQRQIKNLKAAMDMNRHDLNKVKNKIKALDDYEDEDELSDGEAAERKRLRKRARKLKEKERDQEFELIQFLITTRNEFVTTMLHQKYSSRVDGQLQVFCVSNTLYNQKRNEPKDKSLRYLELSGIIEVRKHCISIVAQAQRRVVLQFINDQIPALLSKIQLWAQSGARTGDEERLAATITALDVIERQLRKDLKEHSGTARIMQQDFNSAVYDKRRLVPWTQFSANTSLDRNGLHHSTYRAFCANYGDHCTPKGGNHDWNSEAMEAMKVDLKEPWEALLSRLEQRQSELEAAIEAIIETIHDRIENELDNEMESKYALIQALEAQQRLLERSLENTFEDLEKQLMILHADTFSGIRTSFMGRQMETSYRTCNNDYGSGVDQRRKRTMNAGFSDQFLFRTLMKRSRESFWSMTENMENQLVNTQNEYLRIVEETLDFIRSENALRESQQDPGFRDRVDDAMREGNAEIRRIKDAVCE